MWYILNFIVIYAVKNRLIENADPIEPIATPIAIKPNINWYINGDGDNRAKVEPDKNADTVPNTESYKNHSRTDGINAPINPINAPSIKNGQRINQFVAPTNFIISISVLLEKIVIRMVFEIRKIAVKINATMIIPPTVRIVEVIWNNFSASAPP